MNRFNALWLPCLLSLSTTAASAQQVQINNNESKVSPNLINQTIVKKRYLVSFKHQSVTGEPMLSEKLMANLQTAINLSGAELIKPLKRVNGAAFHMTDTQAKALEKLPNVRYVEPDPKRYLQAEQTPYGLALINATGQFPDLTDNRKVCIIDSGYDITHEDLMSGAHVTGELSTALAEHLQLSDWSTDTYGHGTHVAGVLSALANSTGTKGVSAENNLNLHIVKIIDNPNSWEMYGSDMIDALERCEAAGSHLVNISIGGQHTSMLEQEAFQLAWDKGMLMVASAGNRGSNALFYPASYESVISVGAVDQNKTAWQYSQTNSQVEFTAPGVGVYSTLPGNQYSSWDGTSVAAPFITGAAAQVWSQYPECRNVDIRTVLQQTAEDLGEPARDTTFGFGLVQMDAAIAKIKTLNCANYNQVVSGRVVIEIPHNTPASLSYIVNAKSEPTNGTLSYAAGGGYRYTPNPGYTGHDKFIYTDTSGKTNEILIYVGLPSNNETRIVPDSNTHVKETKSSSLPGGGYVTAWNQSGGIWFQAFDDAGNSLIDPIQVYAANGEWPQIAVSIHGDVTITWRDSATGELFCITYDSNWQLKGQLTVLSTQSTSPAALGYSADGSKVLVTWANNGLVSTRIYQDHQTVTAFEPTDNGSSPWLQPLPNGNFFIFIIINGEVVCILYDENGNQIGDPIVVSTVPTATTDEPFQIITAPTPSGVVVSWTEQNPDTGEKKVKVRNWDGSGTPLSPELTVSPEPTKQKEPSVTALPNGNIAVSWTEEQPETASQSTHIRYYEPDGTPVTPALPLQPQTPGIKQSSPVLSTLPNGRIIIVLNTRSGEGAHMFPPSVAAGVSIQFGGDSNDVITNTGNEGIINAGDGDDVLTGNGSLSGDNGNDTIYLEGGTDNAIDGGEGLDTLIFTGGIDDYQITDNGNGEYTITDSRNNNPDGTTLVTGVEILEFNDDRLALPLAETIPLLPTDHIVQVVSDYSGVMKFFATAETLPANGTLEPYSGGWRYAPNDGFMGVDEFTYLDAQGNSKTVRITVGLPVNGDTIDFGYGHHAQLAADAEGNLIAAWQANGDDILLQRFYPDGAVNGTEITVVNSQASYPSIDIASDGRFAVTYLIGSNAYLQFFDAAGAMSGEQISLGLAHSPARITFLLDGTLVTSWHVNGRILLRIYDKEQQQAGGAIAGFPTAANKQYAAHLTPLTDGGFMLAGQVDGNIMTQRFAPNGNSLGSAQVINQSPVPASNEPQQVAITQLRRGGFVVSWTQTTTTVDDNDGWSIQARQYDINGNPVTPVFTVNETTVTSQQAPTLAALQSGGWVVAWWSETGDLSKEATFARYYDHLGNPASDEKRLSNDTLHGQYRPALIALADGRLAGTMNRSDTTLALVFPGVGTTGTDILEGGAGNNTLYASSGDDIINAGAGNDIIYGGLQIDGGSGNDIFYGGVYITAGDGNDDIYALGGDRVVTGGTGADTVIFSGNVEDYRITLQANGSYLIQDIRAGSPDGYSTLWDVEAIEFNNDRRALPLATSEPLTTTDHLVQLAANSTVAMDFVQTPDSNNPPQHGSLVTIDGQWHYQPGQDFSGIDTFHYLDASGSSKRVELHVELPGNHQYQDFGSGNFSSVSTFNDGSFIVTWINQGDDVWLQRFSASGTALGQAKLIDNGGGNMPLTAVASDGSFAISYRDVNSSHLQFFDNKGFEKGNFFNQGEAHSATAIDFLSNQHTVTARIAWGRIVVTHYNPNQLLIGQPFDAFPGGTNTQSAVSLIAMHDGGFIIAGLVDGSIKTQRFSHTMKPIGDAITVSTEPNSASGEFQQIAIQPLKQGGWVVAWTQTTGGDNDGWSIYARQYSVSGNPLAPPQLINQTTESNQRGPSLAALNTGGWAISWWSSVGDGSNQAAYIRYFDHNGQATTDEQRIVPLVSQGQYRPSIATLPDGRLIASANRTDGILALIWPTTGTDNDDIFRPMPGLQNYYGNGGNDTIYYPALIESFNQTPQSDGSLLIHDTRSGSPWGIEWLYNMEHILFSQ